MRSPAGTRAFAPTLPHRTVPSVHPDAPVASAAAPRSALPEPPQWTVGSRPLPPRRHTLWGSSGTRPCNDLTAPRRHWPKRPLPDGLRAPFLWCRACASRGMPRERGRHGRPRARGGGWLRPAACSSERPRPRAGPGAAEALEHPAGHQGPAPPGGKKALGRRARGRRPPREPGRGQADQARPALSAWLRRQGLGGSQAPSAGTVKAVPQAAGLAGRTGRRLSTAAASSERAGQGARPAGVKQPQKGAARGEVHEQRAAGRGSLRQPSLRVCRGRSQDNLPGSVGFLPSLRHARQQHAGEPAELSWRAALDPAMATRARRGEGVRGGTILIFYKLR